MGTIEVKLGPKDATEDSVLQSPFMHLEMLPANSTGKYDRDGGAAALIYSQGLSGASPPIFRLLRSFQ